jgi:hypothetical protein
LLREPGKKKSISGISNSGVKDSERSTIRKPCQSQDKQPIAQSLKNKVSWNFQVSNINKGKIQNCLVPYGYL